MARRRRFTTTDLRESVRLLDALVLQAEVLTSRHADLPTLSAALSLLTTVRPVLNVLLEGSAQDDAARRTAPEPIDAAYALAPEPDPLGPVHEWPEGAEV